MASTKHVKRFEIFWANLDPTIGSEIQKNRPCVVVSPDEMNRILNTVIVVPLTHTVIDWPFRIVVNSTKSSSAACDHLRSISKQRLGRKIGVLAPRQQGVILEILRNIFS